MRLKNIVETCGGCPSQWEAETEDGYPVYVRYRWGYLSIRVAKEKEGDAVGGEEVLGRQVGDSLDGVMSQADMLWHAESVAWPPLPEGKVVIEGDELTEFREFQRWKRLNGGGE